MNDMNKTIRKRFYETQAWKDTRNSYLRSVGGLCEKCLAEGIVTPAEAVHHITPLTDENVNDASISLSWDNLQALCRKCHADAHDDIYRERSGRRYKIDKNGKVIVAESR